MGAGKHGDIFSMELSGKGVLVVVNVQMFLIMACLMVRLECQRLEYVDAVQS